MLSPSTWLALPYLLLLKLQLTEAIALRLELLPMLSEGLLPRLLLDLLLLLSQRVAS